MRGIRISLPYDKAAILNAAYDALDAMGFSIISSDSVKGTLCVESESRPNQKGRIAVIHDTSKSAASVEICTDDGEKQQDRINAFLNEVSVLIKSTGMEALI